MATARRLFLRLLASIRPGHGESDMAREIASPLQLLKDRFVARGMSREGARYAARRAFGGVGQVKERQRDARAFRWLTGLAARIRAARVAPRARHRLAQEVLAVIGPDST